MGIFTDYDYYAPQFWIAGRYLESVSVVGAFAFLGTHRRVNLPVVVGAYTVVTAGLVASILIYKTFPVCFVAGQGLTPFKVTSEYIICAILAAGIAILYWRRHLFDRRVYRLVQVSMLLMIVMELCFTLYVADSMSDSFNEIGHLCKIAAYYLIYKAVVVTGLRDPLTLLYRDLKASEASLLEAQHLARLGRWEWELGSGRWTWTSEAFRLFGLAETVTPGLDTMLAAVQPQDRPTLQKSLRRAAETGAPFDLLLHLGPTEGEIRIADMRGEGVTRPDGTVGWVVGTLQDVTIKQFSVESAGDSVAWLTPSGHIAYVNRAACDLLGYGRDELLTLRASDINRTLAPSAFAEQWRALKETGSLRFETVFTRKDGTTVPVEICENHVVYAGDEYNVMFARDMTQHKAAEAKITVLKDMYAALSHANQAIIHCPDRQSLFDEVTNIAVEFGHFRLAWIGLVDDRTQEIRPVAAAGEGRAYADGLQVSASADSPYGQGPTGRCVRSGAFFIANDFARSTITKPWHERQARFGFQAAAAFPIANGGRIVGALTLYSDTANFFTAELIDLLTEMSLDISTALDRLDLMAAKRKHEEELRKAVEILTATNAELGRFAFVASHDLQEPLRAIVLFSQLLERRLGGALKSEDLEYFGFVKDAARQMSQLIHDLLEYSQVSGKGGTFAPVSLHQVCRSAIDTLSESIADSGATVEIEDLPEVTGDSVQLMQLFQNLISNAIKFRRAPEPPRVQVSASRADDEWVISVQDNGIGIAATDQDIFEIFRRQHAGGSYSGSGIGLAICRRIVESHHGRIWYESVPGGGSTFKFTLPAASQRPGQSA